MESSLKDSNFDYIRYKVLSNQLLNITNMCNDSCISNFNSKSLLKDEIDCIDKCSKVLLSNSQYLVNKILDKDDLFN